MKSRTFCRENTDSCGKNATFVEKKWKQRKARSPVNRSGIPTKMERRVGSYANRKGGGLFGEPPKKDSLAANRPACCEIGRGNPTPKKERSKPQRKLKKSHQTNSLKPLI